MQLAATLMLLLSTPFFLRYWGAQHPPSLDWLVARVRWAMDMIPVTVSLWAGIILFGLGILLGAL